MTYHCVLKIVQSQVLIACSNEVFIAGIGDERDSESHARNTVLHTRGGEESADGDVARMSVYTVDMCAESQEKKGVIRTSSRRPCAI